jgi:hypothetical protein
MKTIKELPLSDHEARRICQAAERMTKHLSNPHVHVACAWSAARDAMLNYLTDRGYSVEFGPGLESEHVMSWKKDEE